MQQLSLARGCAAAELGKTDMMGEWEGQETLVSMTAAGRVLSI